MSTGTDLLPTRRDAIPTLAPNPAAEALRLLLEDSRSPETRRAYERDLADFFRYHAGSPATREAVNAFCAQEGPALALALNGYKADMRTRGLAEATINRRLAAVRALLRMARRLGAPCPDPAGLVASEKVTSYRDTRGPAESEAAQLLGAPDRQTLRGKRDYALLLLLMGNALRRGEVHRCDVGDFDPGTGRLSILGKGRGSQKEEVTLDEAAAEALTLYLDARRQAALLTPADPLFVNAARFSDGCQRLSGRGLLHVVNEYGLRVLGKPLHPHALRHMAITALLEATGGNVERVQKFSRHKDVRTVMIYNDRRQDTQGEMTRLLTSRLLGLASAGKEQA